LSQFTYSQITSYAINLITLFTHLVYRKSLFVSFQRLPSEDDILYNFYSKISDLYFERYFLIELASLLYSALWEGRREV